MKPLFVYIKENINNIIELINEDVPHFYQKYPNKRFNYKLVSHGHAAERDMERLISDAEVVGLMKDVWTKVKNAIETGKVLINQKDTKKSGSSIAIHSSEKTRTGYLTIIIFPSKYHKNAQYYDIEVVTTWKGKTMDSYKEYDEEGKTMYHPEYGQLDIWDNFGNSHYEKQDIWQI